MAILYLWKAIVKVFGDLMDINSSIEIISNIILEIS
jgi:hypothetical protein